MIMETSGQVDSDQYFLGLFVCLSADQAPPNVSLSGHVNIFKPICSASLLLSRLTAFHQTSRLCSLFGGGDALR